MSISGDATAVFFSEHKDVFSTKNTLQLKIREVRQKMMGIQHANEEMVHHTEHKPSSPKPTNSHENATPYNNTSSSSEANVSTTRLAGNAKKHDNNQ